MNTLLIVGLLLIIIYLGVRNIQLKQEIYNNIFVDELNKIHGESEEQEMMENPQELMNQIFNPAIYLN